MALLKRLKKPDGLLGKILSRALHWLFLDRLTSAILNAWVSWVDFRTLRKTEGSLVIERTDRFGEEINQLWEKVSPYFFAAIKRDEGYTDWKYCRQPFMNYSFFSARRQGELVGTLILRVGKPPERNLGILADLFTSPDDPQVILEILGFAVRYFKSVGVKDIVAATTVHAYQEGLEKLGFKKTREDFPMFHCSAEITEGNRAIEPGVWCLGKADHDWDQYPLAR